VKPSEKRQHARTSEACFSPTPLTEVITIKKYPAWTTAGRVEKPCGGLGGTGG